VTLVRPRALRPGDRVAVAAPASPFDRELFDRGLAELERLELRPTYDDRVFARRGFTAGDAALRAAALRDALADPTVAGVFCARGGYGSAQALPLLDPDACRDARKPIIGYSDVTALLSFLVCQCGLVAFHGPMLAGRLSEGAAGYDRDSLVRVLMHAAPAGELSPEGLDVLRPGEAHGPLLGGTLTQLCASLGTPFAFDPPQGCVLFIEDTGERPYRLDRMLTQLRQAGVLGRAAAIVFGQMPRCDEPGGSPTARDTASDALDGFRGPAIFGFPSGHATSPAYTLPLGVEARVIAGRRPALVIEEAAVE
jgi:muramoyltetrapeptide carboxypeptidase